MRLQLRQIEVRSGPTLQLLTGVVEHHQPEIEQRRGHGCPVDLVMALDEMPAARTDQQRRRLVVQPVALLAGVQLDRSPHRIVHVALPLTHVVPGRRVRILEVRHEHLRARVERVDHHLPLDRPGDLDPPVLQIGRRRRDRELLRRPHKPQLRPPPRLPRRQQTLSLRIQLTMQPLDERRAPPATARRPLDATLSRSCGTELPRRRPAFRRPHVRRLQSSSPGRRLRSPRPSRSRTSREGAIRPVRETGSGPG